MIDAEAIPNHVWQVGDTLTVKVIDVMGIINLRLSAHSVCDIICNHCYFSAHSFTSSTLENNYLFYICSLFFQLNHFPFQSLDITC